MTAMPDRYGEPPADTAGEYPTRADLKAIHIRSCGLCDDDGYRGHSVCDHQDHAAAAARGIEAVRAQMGWTHTTTPEEG